MTAYELTYLLTIVIIFYRALINFFIFLKHRTANFLFYFALTEVFFALYLIFVLETINVAPEQALIFERLENATIPLIAVFFMVFAQKLEAIYPRRILYGIIAVNLMAALAILVLPGAYHEELRAPKSFPALGVTFYETEQPIWVALHLVLNFVLLVTVLARLTTSGTGLFTGSLMLKGALGVLTVLFLNDILVSLQIIYNPYLTHFGFLLTMFSMEYILQVKARGGPESVMAAPDTTDATSLPPTPEAPVADSSATQDASEQPPDEKNPGTTAAPPTSTPGKFASINCLGPLEIIVDGDAIAFSEIARKRKLLKLFKLLLVHFGRGLHREAAIEALWPELSEANAYNNLHALCFRLRKFFRKGELIVLTEEQLYLDPELVETDFVTFEERLDRGLAHYNRKDFDAAMAMIENAAALYRGPFFEFDPYFEPAAAHRDHLSMKYRKVLQALCEMHYERGAFDRVLEYSRIAIDMDDLDEGSWRYLFRGLQLTGRKNEALKKYEELKKLLKRELDVHPDDATEKLIQAVKADQRDPAKL